MGILISFPTERCSSGAGHLVANGSASVIILPVIRIERESESPADIAPPSSSSPRGKRRKR